MARLAAPPAGHAHCKRPSSEQGACLSTTGELEGGGEAPPSSMGELEGGGEAPPSSMGELEGGGEAPPSSISSDRLGFGHPDIR